MSGEEPSLSHSFQKLIEVGLVAKSAEEPAGTLDFSQAAARLVELNDSERAIARPALKYLIANADAAIAGPIALMVGAATERGFSPEYCIEIVTPGLERALTLANTCLAQCEKRASECGQDSDNDGIDVVEEYGPWVTENFPHESAFFDSLKEFCLPLIAALSRSKTLRKSFPYKDRLIHSAEDLASCASGAGFLIELLRTLDDEPLLVLHPREGLGFRFTMSGISGNYQLHVLLSHSLIGQWPEGRIRGKKPHPKVAAAYVNQEVDPDFTVSEGSFDLLNWTALQPSGFLPAGSTLYSNMNHAIWGEGVPADILTFDNQRVVLLSEPTVQRTWNTGRTFTGLVAELKIDEVLPRVRVRHLLETMGRKAAEAQQ